MKLNNHLVILTGEALPGHPSSFTVTETVAGMPGALPGE